MLGGGFRRRLSWPVKDQLTPLPVLRAEHALDPSDVPIQVPGRARCVPVQLCLREAKRGVAVQLAKLLEADEGLKGRNGAGQGGEDRSRYTKRATSRWQQLDGSAGQGGQEEERVPDGDRLVVRRRILPGACLVVPSLVSYPQLAVERPELGSLIAHSSSLPAWTASTALRSSRSRSAPA